MLQGNEEVVLPSVAWIKFNENAVDVRRLIKIHATAGGYPQEVEVLNKSAVVLIAAVWEAFCEDLAAEARKHLVAHIPRATALPDEVKRPIATHIENKEKNEPAIWDLADDGWKAVVLLPIWHPTCAQLQ